MIFSFSGSAQETLGKLNFVESAKKFKDKERTEAIKAMLVTDDKIATVRFGFNNIIWDVSDKDMNREFSELIEGSDMENYRGHVNVGNTIKLFTSVYGKFLFQTFYCYTFDIEKKTYTKEEFFKSGYKRDDGKPSGLANFRSVNFSVSPNKKYFAFAIDDYSADRNSYTIRVFNTADHSLVYKNYYSKDTAQYYEYGHSIVNDDAEVYLIGKTFFKGKKVLRKGEVNYEYTLHKITKNKIVDLTIPIQTELVHALQIQDKGDELLLIGNYAKTNRRDVNGVYTIKVDKTNLTLKNRNAQKLPLQIYKDLHEESKALKLYENNAALDWYWFKEALTDSQGNTYLFMHRFFLTDEDNEVVIFRGSNAYNIPDGQLHRVTLNYNFFGFLGRTYKDLLVFKLDNQGKLLWGRALETTRESFASKPFIKDDLLHLMFSANCNLKPEKDGRTKIVSRMFKKVCIYNLVFDANGKKIIQKFPYKGNFKSFTYEMEEGYFEKGVFVTPITYTLKKRFLKFY
jgi:hypothetical protein